MDNLNNYGNNAGQHLERIIQDVALLINGNLLFCFVAKGA